MVRISSSTGQLTHRSTRWWRKIIVVAGVMPAILVVSLWIDSFWHRYHIGWTIHRQKPQAAQVITYQATHGRGQFHISVTETDHLGRAVAELTQIVHTKSGQPGAFFESGPADPEWVLPALRQQFSWARRLGFQYENGTYNLVADLGAIYRFRLLRLPDWFLLLLTTFPALFSYRAVRLLRQRRAGLCPKCGYDLRASTDRCPECGRKFAEAAHGNNRISRASNECPTSTQEQEEPQ